MNAATLERDERTIAVENASYRWGYLLLAFGLLASVAYRAFVHGQASWELLGLVILSGALTTFLQSRERVLTPRSARLAIVGVVVAAIIAAVLVALLR